MIYADQTLICQLKKPLERACKEIGKHRGWKTIAGKQYQVRGEMLYILRVSLPLFDSGQTAEATLRCKPMALDEMYWDVFRMKEEADKQPFSFHVHGAFTAPALWLAPWKQPLPSPEELPLTIEAIFDQAEDMVKELHFPDIATFRRALEKQPQQRSATLGVILCLLCEEKYQQAMCEISAAMARHDNGGFSREGGKRSIMEDAKDWCAARLAAGTQPQEK